MTMARLTLLVAAGLLALSVGACENTVRGFGQDMQKTGKAIEKATGTGGSSSSSSQSTSGSTTTQTKTQ